MVTHIDACYRLILWWGHVEASCWLSLYTADCTHFCLDPSSHQILQCIHHNRLDTKLKDSRFLMQKLPLHENLRTSAKFNFSFFVMWWRWPHHSRHGAYLQLIDWPHWNFKPVLGLSMALHCCWYLFKDSVALTIQSGDSGHILVVLKTNLYYVFIFPDNLKYVNSVTFITNITQHWAESQDIL